MTTKIESHKPDYCPHCNCDLAYWANGQTFSRKIGVEVPMIYDGVAYWLCPYCGDTWPREGMEHLYEKAAIHRPPTTILTGQSSK